MKFKDYDYPSDECGLAMLHNINVLAAVGQGLLNSKDAGDSDNPDGAPLREATYLYIVRRRK